MSTTRNALQGDTNYRINSHAPPPPQTTICNCERPPPSPKPENDPPGARPPLEPSPSPERSWFLRPREEQIELLDELDEVLIVGYPYTGRGEILDKLTPEDHSGWGLEKANTFRRELQQKYNCPRRKGDPWAWMTP